MLMLHLIVCAGYCLSFSIPSAIFAQWTGHCINVMHFKMLPFNSVIPISPHFNMVLFFFWKLTSLLPLPELLHMTCYKKKKIIALLFGYFSSWSQQIPVLNLSVFCTCLFAISFLFFVFLCSFWILGEWILSVSRPVWMWLCSQALCGSCQKFWAFLLLFSIIFISVY